MRTPTMFLLLTLALIALALAMPLQAEAQEPAPPTPVLEVQVVNSYDLPTTTHAVELARLAGHDVAYCVEAESNPAATFYDCHLVARLPVAYAKVAD